MTHTAHGLVAGNMLGLATDGALPTGLDTLEIYYHKAIDANSYNLSRTAQGASKGITNLAVTFDPATDIFTAAAHGLDIGDPIRLTATTMPTGFSAGTDYYVASTSFTTGQFRLALTKGGAAIAGTTAGSAVLAHTLISTSGTQSGTHTAAEIVGRTNELIQASQNGLGQLVLANVALAVPILLTNIITGSRVRISLASDNSEIYLGTASGSTISTTTKISGNVYVDVRKKGYIPYRQAAVIDGAAGLTLYVSQVADTVVV